MPLGTEVDLGPGHIVLDVDPESNAPPSRQGHNSRIFCSHIYCYCGQTVAHLNYC